jgi:hypothetical protein
MAKNQADPNILSLDMTNLGFALFKGDKLYATQPVQVMLSEAAWLALGSPEQVAVTIAPVDGGEVASAVTLVDVEPMMPTPEVVFDASAETKEEDTKVNLREAIVEEQAIRTSSKKKVD